VFETETLPLYSYEMLKCFAVTGKSSSTMQARAQVMQVITASHASSLNRHHESAYFAGGNLHYIGCGKKMNNSLEKVGRAK